MVLTDDQKRAFIRNGYIILGDAVPRPLIIAACKPLNAVLPDLPLDETGIIPQFPHDLTRIPEIGDIPANTILQEACDDLLGTGNARWGGRAHAAFRKTDKRMVDKGMTLDEPMSSDAWHVDGGHGKYRPNATAFSLLLGVCLADGQDVDENRGQLNVWPGSHVKCHALMRERIKKGLVDGQCIFGDKTEKPDLGAPIRVLLKPGDAVLAHQRLAHAGGVNLVKKTRKNLYFRVRHVKHDQIFEEICGGSVWRTFEGLHALARNGGEEGEE